MKKKAKLESKSTQVSAGQYGPEYRSPQAVPWMEADGVGYLKPGHQRALRIREQAAEFAQQDRVLKNRAEYQGGGTFRLGKGKLPTN